MTRLIDANDLKEAIMKLPNDNSRYYYTGDLLDRERVLDEIDNAPTVEEIEKPHHSECRNRAIKENLPLYFVYYEKTGVFEVYKTDTEELFEKRHCVKYMPAYEFQQLAIRYLDEYSDWKGGTEND